MKTDMLARLEREDVHAVTYLRAWYVVRAKEAIGDKCCKQPVCRSVMVLAGWWERLAVVPWEA